MMKPLPNRGLQVALWFVGLAAGFCMIAAALRLPDAVRRGIQLGSGLAVLNGLLSYASLRWAFPKTDKIFFSAFAVGVIGRLILLGLAAYFVISRPAFDLVSTLLTLVFSTTLFLILEFEHLPKKSAAHGF